MKTTRQHFALRLQPLLTEEAKKVGKAEGVAVNQLIKVTAADKVSSLLTEESFAESAAQRATTRKRFTYGTQPLALAARMMPVRSNNS